MVEEIRETRAAAEAVIVAAEVVIESIMLNLKGLPPPPPPLLFQLQLSTINLTTTTMMNMKVIENPQKTPLIPPTTPPTHPLHYHHHLEV